MLKPVVLTLALALAAGRAYPAAALAPGRVTEKIAVGSGEQQYALYLPSGYTADRKWPIVYALDARGEAMTPIERFRAGAETYGYIVASSYNSASDGEFDPNVRAMRSMWTDTHATLSIDDSRVYVAGFSGTVRAAVYLALAAPKSMAGIIGAGAGFPSNRPPTAETPFLFFGTVGDRDFNFGEMDELEGKLSALHLPHRIEGFSGPHDWMPPELASEALRWMALRAMRAGVHRDPAFIAESWTADLASANAREKAGELLEAHRLYAAMASDYAGLRDTAPVVAAAARLDASRDYIHLLTRRATVLREENDYLSRAQSILKEHAPGGTIPDVRGAATELRIASLRKRAEGTDKEDSVAAKRIMNALLAQTGFYLPQAMEERKDYIRAAYFLGIAAEIMPADADRRFAAATGQARAGNRRAALADLKRAVELGFKDFARLEREEAWKELRTDPAVAALRK
jgi:predicted esterase